jgi:hypothetical protein
VLFRLGDPPDAVYVIQSGSVLCQIDYSVTSVVGQRLAAAADKDADSLKRQPRWVLVEMCPNAYVAYMNADILLLW